jgi:hypothetical protein
MVYPCANIIYLKKATYFWKVDSTNHMRIPYYMSHVSYKIASFVLVTLTVGTQ